MRPRLFVNIDVQCNAKPMNLKDELFPAGIIWGTCKDVTFFTCANLWTNSINDPLFREDSESEVVIASIRQSIAIIYKLIQTLSSKHICWRCKTDGNIHFAFRSLEINPTLASSAIDLETVPDLNFAICVINGVGTTRWFLLPISTYSRKSLQRQRDVWYVRL
jgi:hypothetical protein